MTNEEAAQLMQNQQFIGRVKVAVLRYADSILSNRNLPGVAGTVSAFNWAQNAIRVPDGVAQQVTPAAVMDASVQQSGADIDDQKLQSAVEYSINKTL